MENEPISLVYASKPLITVKAAMDMKRKITWSVFGKKGTSLVIAGGKDMLYQLHSFQFNRMKGKDFVVWPCCEHPPTSRLDHNTGNFRAMSGFFYIPQKCEQ